MGIVYITSGIHPGNIKNRILVQKKLSGTDIDVKIISDSEFERKVLERNGGEYRHVGSIQQGCVDSTDISENIESEFSVTNLRATLFTSRVLTNRSEDNLIREAHEKFHAYDRMFAESDVDVVIQTVGGNISTFARFYAAKKNNIRHVYLFPCVFDDRILVMYEHGDWNLTDEAEPDSEDRDLVESWMTETKSQQKDHGNVGRGAEIVSYEKLRKVGEYVRRTAIDPSHTDKSLKYLLRDNLYRRARSKLAEFYYESPDLDSDYLFFPLHFPKESQVTIRGHPYQSQEFLAELLDRYVPTGIDVYVKEHPNHPGALNVEAVRRIASLEQTKLIPPSTNSHELIRNANGVAVINSTVGMEALLYQQPVVTFGKSVYRGQGVTIDIIDPYEIPEKLARIDTFAPDKEDVVDFFLRMYQSSYPAGIFYTGDPWWNKRLRPSEAEQTVQFIQQVVAGE